LTYRQELGREFRECEELRNALKENRGAPFSLDAPANTLTRRALKTRIELLNDRLARDQCIRSMLAGKEGSP
jgi:hypothetical protein